MIGPVLALALAAAAPGTADAPGNPTVGATPAAVQLFERDWVLMNWALKFYDADDDILLNPSEAEKAAAEFRRIADGDSDGRVTPVEFRQARDFIKARY
ncbi:MAG TPA: hypothetical protein VIL42_03130 [Sphingomicrobium sp.]|jgi:hypothetical protein